MEPNLGCVFSCESEAPLDSQNGSGRCDPCFTEEELSFIRLGELSKVVGPAGADLGHRPTA